MQIELGQSLSSSNISNTRVFIMLERKRGIYDGRNNSSAYKDLVWTVATSSDVSVGIEQQTELTLETIQ